jgi:acyl-CoA synthetase (AMP-forming)/AMP-acid ligase II
MAPAAFLQRPARWLQAISRFGATHSGGPNFAYDLCARRVQDDERDALDLSTWRIAFNGSEPVRRSTLESFHRRFAPCGFRWEAFRPAYGLAESTLLVTSTREDEPPQFIDIQPGRSLVSCGTVHRTPRIRIVDPATSALVGDGAVGEIWVAGRSVAQGYWNQPRESAATFQATIDGAGDGPYLRTGDLGCIVNDRLFVTGRMKDVLIVRGVKHYPQDLEATAERAHPAVRAGCCAAFSVERHDEERIVVVAEMDPRRSVGDDDVERTSTAIRLAIGEAHQVDVADVKLLPAGTLPRTTSGKLQRYLCRESFLAGSWDGPPWDSPKGPHYNIECSEPLQGRQAIAS